MICFFFGRRRSADLILRILCSVVLYTLRAVFLYTLVLFLNAAQSLVTAPKHDHSLSKSR